METITALATWAIAIPVLLGALFATRWAWLQLVALCHLALYGPAAYCRRMAAWARSMQAYHADFEEHSPFDVWSPWPWRPAPLTRIRAKLWLRTQRQGGIPCLKR